MATRNPYGLGGWWLEEREYAQLLDAARAKEEAERERQTQWERAERLEKKWWDHAVELKAERDAATTALRAAEAEVVGLRQAISLCDKLCHPSWGHAEACPCPGVLISSAPLARAVVDRITGEERERAAAVVFDRQFRETEALQWFHHKMVAAIRALPKRES